MLIFGKNKFKNLLLQIELADCLENGRLRCKTLCSNPAPGLTLTYLTVWSNLVSHSFVWKKVKTIDFSEILVDEEIKISNEGSQMTEIKVSFLP